MSVIGFDFGNLSCYTACARGGGIETLANEYSARMTPSYVSFTGNQRLMGTASQQAQVTNLKNTFYNLKRFIGRFFNDPRVLYEKEHFSPLQMVEGPDNSILFQAQYMGESKTFTPEQLIAMLFTKLKENAESALDNKKVTDCVISVPSYLTDQQRRKLLEAAQMANLNCLKLMNETTAVALGYGIYKKDLPAPEEAPRHVVFVDFGHSSLQASVVAMYKGKLKMLAAVSDPDIGGRNFDLRLAERFNEDFKQRYKIDARKNPRAFLRLLAECEKMKKLMSANATELPLNIECLMDDVDVTARMKRDDFEALCDDLFVRIESAFTELLSKCGLTAEQIHSVEVVGGGSRVPACKRLVQKVFGKEPSTTLNADEAVARGCALQCAILSPTFRVRDFEVDDCQNYPIELVFENTDGERQAMEAFPQWSGVPASKMLTFYRKEPFSVRAMYGKPLRGQLPYPNPVIGDFHVGDVVPDENGEAVKVKVKVRVDMHGIFKVSQAQMVIKKKGEEEKMETEEEAAVAAATAAVPPPADPPMESGVPNGPADPATAAPAEAPAAESAPMDSAEAPAADAAPGTEAPPLNGQSEKAEEEQKEEKKKIKTQSIPLTVHATVTSMDHQTLTRYHELENQMIAQDRQERDRQHAKNAVEEYVFEARRKLYEEWERFVKEDDRDHFSLTLEKTEEWLYEDGEDEVKSVYQAKLNDLKAFGNPISERYKEFTLRPKAFENLQASIVKAQAFVERFQQGEETIAHIPADDVFKVDDAAKAAINWAKEQMDAQARKALTDTPIVLAAGVEEERRKLENICVPIMSKPKPKPKKKAEPPADEKTDPPTETTDNAASSTNGYDSTDTNVPNGDVNGDVKMDSGVPEASAADAGPKVGGEMDLD